MLHGYKIAAVCVSKIHEAVLIEFLQSLSDTLAAQNWRVLVFTTGTDLFWKSKSNMGEECIFDLIDTDTTDALVIFNDKILDISCLESIISRAQGHDIPVFFLNGMRENCCCVNFDYKKGFANVVRHLIEVHGVHDFHYIGGFENNEYSDERRDAMRKVLDEYSIPFGNDRISYGNFWSVPARDAAKKLIDEHRLPRAIVCANDTMAIAVCVELHQNGYRVPEDVIVTGFDGIDAIHYSIPTMTSAFCDYGELGAAVGSLIVRSGNGEEIPGSLFLEPKPLLQESCGCQAQKALDMVDFINGLNNTFNRFQTEDELLGEISSKIQGSTTLDEIHDQLHHEVFYSMTAVLKKETIDFSLDPMRIHSGTAFGEEVYVVQDTDVWESERQLIPVRSLVPRLADMFQTGKAIVFIALHQIDIPLGYLSFHFQDYGRQSYLKINQIALSLSSAIAGFRNAQYQKHLQAKVDEMYKYDALTGLYNRIAFLKRFRQMMEGTVSHSLTLVLCDLDGLKYINDHFSHTEGDNAIAVTANALHEACREGLCCRYGGDELVAVLNRAADPAALRAEILHLLDSYNQTSGKPYQVSASIGIYTSSSEGFEQMFEKADALMYQDKTGKPHRRT